MVLGFNDLPEKLMSALKRSEKSAHNEASELYFGLEAYQFLLETICGLKSRILGENEIVHQFKEAYLQFMETERPNRLVQNLLEKLFKDAKDIRSEYLKNIGLQTYAGITRKLLIERLAPNESVVLLGSGELAEDLLKICGRRFNLILCARNNQRVQELKKSYSFEVLPWEKRDDALMAANIINTIGTKDEIFTSKALKDFSQQEDSKLVIDLAEPSPVPWKELRPLESKRIFTLEEVFQQGERYNQEKRTKVQSATNAIKERTKHRESHFTLHLPFGWDELQFA